MGERTTLHTELFDVEFVSLPNVGTADTKERTAAATEERKAKRKPTRYVPPPRIAMDIGLAGPGTRKTRRNGPGVLCGQSSR